MVGLAIVAGWCAASLAADAAPPVSTDLISSAQGILSAHCYKCHGAEKQESGLRLDVAANALKGGDGGVDIRPGHAADSLLIEYVSGKGDTVMPPKGERLTSAEVATLAAWINGGANWPANSSNASDGDPRLMHWSYQPVRRIDPPAVQNQAWVRNEIDAFVLSKLEHAGISPSPEASRQTLIRRLSFDLLGFPPAPQDVNEFLADARPDAYERLVDRLLASPHFGERWGRHWLDRARYADSSGCAIDLYRPFAWRWRDWVIEAVNRDLPFDQFTIQQIAGDLLPNATTETCIAAGFQRNALSNHEAGIDLEAERVKTTLDRTSAVGTAWLGLTLGCAECHAHKYDPISQRDFYSLYAFFDSLENCLIDAPRTNDANQLAAARQPLEAARDKFLAAGTEGQSQWEAKVAAQPPVWKTPHELELPSFRSAHFATLHPLDNGSLFVDGRLSSTDSYTIACKAPVHKLTAIRVESLCNPYRFDRGPGRGADQRAVLTGISVQVGQADKSLPLVKAEIASAQADYCESGFAAADAIPCGETAGWALDQIGVPHAAVFVLSKPLDVPDGGRLVVRLEQYTGSGNNLARFRISVTDCDPQQLAGPVVPDEIRHLVDLPPTHRTSDDQAALQRYYQSISQPENAALHDWNSARANFAKLCGTYAAQSICERTIPRETFVHLRGDFRRPGDKVEPALLSAFSKGAPISAPAAPKKEDDEEDVQLSPHRLTRLDLAEWLVDPANPLTARVAANDCWQHLFGVGLVDTPGDFGMQGDAPAHPELLDWLASEYIRCGWSRKAMIRRIVTSATYRQSSAARSELAERDPQNRLLARQNRFRLEAEAVRDTILAVSGLLNEQIGGRGFSATPSPDDIPDDWEPQLAPQSPSEIYRRGMYAIVKRADPSPLLVALDAPDGAASCPLRRRTDTPIQSLDLMNDSVVVAATRALGKSLNGPASAAVSVEASAEETTAQKISILFQRCLSREPTAAEQNRLVKLFDDVAAQYRNQPEEAAKLAQVDPKLSDAAQAAAWFVVARTVLNLDETITRE
jgi:mono/diheme cytochrome c family protein